MPASSLGWHDKLAARRFAVEQGTKPDGSCKLRACDDFSDNGVNSYAFSQEKLSVDSVDTLHKASASLYRSTGVEPYLLKIDINAAYRRIPIERAHQWLAWVVFLVGGVVMASQHHAFPFGATASVYAWNRFAVFLVFLARRMLHTHLLRSVRACVVLVRSCARV